jgi:hypothetical protein
LGRGLTGDGTGSTEANNAQSSRGKDRHQGDTESGTNNGKG